MRIYAIGDGHGRADLLGELLAKIDSDIGLRPTDKSIHVFLGDYIDRGPASREVLNHQNRALELLGNKPRLFVNVQETTEVAKPEAELSGAELKARMDDLIRQDGILKTGETATAVLFEAMQSKATEPLAPACNERLSMCESLHSRRTMATARGGAAD